MERKSIGLAVIGSGRIGGLRAQLASGHPAVRFIAVADQDPAKAAALAQKIGAALHSADNDAIIAHPEVNAVIVSTSEGEHVAPILKALELGKPVLVEKPIALSTADADRVIVAIEKSGVTGYEAATWYGLLAPARTPQPVINRLHGEVVKILAGPTRQRLEAQGFEPDGGTPAAFAAYIKSEIAKWANVIKTAGIPAE